jgi:hypothetical protein
VAHVLLREEVVEHVAHNVLVVNDQNCGHQFTTRRRQYAPPPGHTLTGSCSLNSSKPFFKTERFMGG